MSGWQAELAAIRRQAAVNCGLDAYPAALIEAWEAVDVHGSAWRFIEPADRDERLARYGSERAVLGLRGRKG